MDIHSNSGFGNEHQTHYAKRQQKIKRTSDIRPRYSLFSSQLSEVVENIDDISYSARCFFDLGGQVYTRHGDDLERNHSK